MEEITMHAAEIKFGDNLFAIENFKTSPEDAADGNPYNASFFIRVVSGAFCGYAFCEYDVREFEKFIHELEEVFSFQRSAASLSDICYGSKVVFSADKTGHLKIAGEIYGNAAAQKLEFQFTADQTCLGAFIKTLRSYF